jgi:micrococcal nuclease
MRRLVNCVTAGALGLVACGGPSGLPKPSAAPESRAATTTVFVAAVTSTAPPATAPPPRSELTVVAATAAPTTEPPTTAASVVNVVNVVDGDTLDLSTGERVRIIGIDTPERGACGFSQAADALAAMVAGRAVVVSPGARDDVDKYGRVLRYIDVDGVDVGLSLIQQGLAVARYDSRDGYGRHAREDAYVQADAASTSKCAPPPSPPSTASATSVASVYYANCTAARAAGAAPLHEGDPGYRPALDRDHDGVACE